MNKTISINISKNGFFLGNERLNMLEYQFNEIRLRNHFYIVESEAAYQYDNPASQDILKLKHLGRKCPHCGYAGSFDFGLKSKYEQDVEQMRVEMEAEKLAEDAADKCQASWSEINNIGVFNK